jgi:hemolysin activation/secretion protein
LLLLLVLSAGGRASAQAIDRPADERPELPPFEEPAEPEPLLPPVTPPAEPRAPLSSGPGIFVARYRIIGSTVFSDEVLQRAVAPFSKREIRSEDLVAVRNAITQLYLDEGYINSGATLPDQELEGAVVEIVIVEGSLGEILLAGNRQLRDGYLRSRIRSGADTPLDVHALQRQIRLLQLDPAIQRVTARLLPGDRLGEAVLYVEVEEADRFQLDVRFDNHEPPSIGSYAGRFGGRLRNLVGVGDQLRAQYTVAEGLNRYEGRFTLPITPWQTRLFLDARYSSADVVEDPFDELDIESTFQSYQVGLVQPVYRSPSQQLALGVIGDWRRAETDLLGTSFSFPGSGADDGETTASVLRFFGDWLRRDPQQVLAARLQVSWGVDALGATTRPSQSFPPLPSGDELPDAHFVAGLLQVQWARRLDHGIETLLRTDAQISSDPLFPMERMAIGGYASVRGYRENQRVRDQGVVSSFEVRVPVYEDPEGWGLFQLAPFVDFGHVWDDSDTQSGDDDDDTLASVGVGLRWTQPGWLSAQIYWGQQLEHVSSSGDLQDDGVHFQIQMLAP